MKLYLIDGTYELFRANFGAPPRTAPDGSPVGAVAGLIQSLLLLLREERPDFIACAFDHVVESFRNDLFDGYKTGEDVPPDLFAQFELAEEATRALGIVTWPMVEFEADDAIATAVARWKDDPAIESLVICSVDKDLMNLVDGSRVVLWDRRRGITYSEPDVVERFGVSPTSIPDYLALVGDSADGIPGVPRWGAKGTAAVLSEYGSLDSIPDSYEDWTITVRGGKTLARNSGREPGGRGLVPDTGNSQDGRPNLREPGRPPVAGRSEAGIPGPLRPSGSGASQSRAARVAMKCEEHPRRDSNPRAWLRRPALYPLSYGGMSFRLPIYQEAPV